MAKKHSKDNHHRGPLGLGRARILNADLKDRLRAIGFTLAYRGAMGPVPKPEPVPKTLRTDPLPVKCSCGWSGSTNDLIRKRGQSFPGCPKCGTDENLSRG